MQYEKVIGLEVHVQLATKSKAFSRDRVVFGAEPNTAVSMVSMAHPGVLPVANRMHTEFAIQLGLALGGQINLENSFDRKHYFYADSPKGYQITQDGRPIVVGGEVALKTRTIRIHHIHMEDDAGKSLHDQHDSLSFVDLNRAGTPLLEIVTEPDFRSGEEVAEFMEYLRQLVRWLGISDGNMEEGSLRCDVNISLRPVGAETYGQRCEIKNMNSMRFGRKAIEYEEMRQTEILMDGGVVEQQTRGFNPTDGTTFPLRDKEDAHDYRYFPDPDLPPIVLTPEYVAQVKAAMPHLPKALKQTCMHTYALTEPEAEILTSERGISDYFLQLMQAAPTSSAKPLAQLLIQKIKPYVEEQSIDYQQFSVQTEQLHAFIALIQNGQVSHSAAYQKLFPALVQEPNTEAERLAVELDLIQEKNEDALLEMARQLLAKNPEKVAEYRKGKKGLLGMFMGELMKEAKGKANPQEATRMLTELLNG
jgi:aspartyl-tRNA(Asn)/glutamyl-tRNA(Gln) amidotransferase subunit B